MTFTAPHTSSSVGLPPAEGGTWVALSEASLPVTDAVNWVVTPSCGGLVVFSGTARDHSPGLTDVTGLVYEAYDTYVVPVFTRIAAEAREQWNDGAHGLGRIVIWHRTGQVDVGESAVVVAVSAPHRAEAFAAARFCIDTVKATAPIWKQEITADGVRWGGGCDGA